MYGWQESDRFDHEVLTTPIFNVAKALLADAPGKTRRVEILWMVATNACFGNGRKFDTFDIIPLLPAEGLQLKQ